MAPQHRSRLSLRSRREFLTHAGSGLGALALTSLLGESGLAAAGGGPFDAKEPHHKPTAKAVIWCFMEGGPSHIDTFDPKPVLEQYAGQPMPESYGRPATAMPGTANNALMPSQREWGAIRPKRLVGIELVSARGRARGRPGGHPLLPGRRLESRRLGVPDEHRLDPRRPPLDGRLGDLTASAPRTATCRPFVILNDEVRINGGAKNWSAGFLPATYQGTLFQQEGAPILNLDPPETVGGRQQRGKLDLLGALNPPPRGKGTRTRVSWTPGSNLTSLPTACRRTRPRRST